MRIPQYNSSLGLTKEVAAVRVNPESFGQQGAMLADMGKTIADIGVKIKQVRMEEDVSRSMIEASRGLNQIEFDAQNDPAVGNEDVYKDRTMQLRETLISGVKDPEAKAAFGVRFDTQAIDTEFRVKQYGYKNLIAQRKVTLNNEIETNTANYLKETNPATKQKYVDQMALSIKIAKDQGVISPGDADASWDKLRQDLPYQQAGFDLMQDPDGTIERLKAGEYGLSPDDTATFIGKAETLREKQVKDYEYRQKIYTLDRQSDSLYQVATGKMPINALDSEAEVASGAWTREFADSFNMYRDSPLPLSTLGDRKKESFVKNLERIFDSNDKEGINASLISIMKSGANGKVNAEDMALAFQVAATRNKNLVTPVAGKDTSVVYKDNSNQNEIDAGFQAIRRTVENMGVVEPGDIYRDYAFLVSSGRTPKEAVDTAIRYEAMRQYPQSVAMKEPPNMILTPDNNIRVIFPQTTNVFPNRIFNPQTRKFEVNYNKEKGSKE